ncbi:MAG: hypothetical protein WC697_01200 [Patescibacteria group bacterium]|jgi:hypothetical protein
MNTFPVNEIKEVNEMLHKLLGFDFLEINFEGTKKLVQGEGFIGKLNKKGDSISHYKIEETLEMLQKTSNKNYLELYRFLNFYYPRLIAFHVIKDSDDKYSEYSSNNELLIALTSIIDRISDSEGYINSNNLAGEENSYIKKFVNFLKINLSEKDLEVIAKNSKIYKKGKLKEIENLKKFAQYVYKIRSMIVHRAELGGIYPYQVDFQIEENKVDNKITLMITPDKFRRLLWKAILTHLGFKIIF